MKKLYLIAISVFIIIAHEAYANNTNKLAVVCKTASISLDNSGVAEVQPNQIDDGSVIASGNFLRVTPNIFDCSHVGMPQSVDLEEVDVMGNVVNSCRTTVSIEDNLAPNAVCGTSTVSLDVNGVATLNAMNLDGGSSDNCGISSFNANPASLDCTALGSNVVTLTVGDVNGNTASCNATVFVEDNLAPNISCNSVPNNEINLISNQVAIIPIAWVSFPVTDNCSNNITNPITGGVILDCSDIGPKTITFSVDDDNGNTGSCSISFNLVDKTVPTAVCKSATIQLDANGIANLTSTDIDGGSFDNCTALSFSVNQSSFSCADVGSNTITLTVSDTYNNIATCNATVIVEDNIAPVAACQPNVTVPVGSNGIANNFAQLVDGGNSFDNCGISSKTVSPNSFDCSQLGAQNVSFTVTDVNGNTTTCSTNINVVDNTPPILSCAGTTTLPLNGNGQVVVDPLSVIFGLSDNCNVDFPLTPVSIFDCTDVGTPQNYNITVSDVNGNTTTCNNIINVVDNLPPTVFCQNITVQLDANGNASISGADIDAGSNDNCGIGSLALDQTNFSCVDVGSNMITLTVTDINGNTATCTANVTVEDNVPPTIFCQANATVAIGNNGFASNFGSLVDGGNSFDNCAIASKTVSPSSFDCNQLGAQSVSLTVTDVNGNMATCSTSINVVDNTSPQITCAGAVTLLLDNNGSVTIDPLIVIYGLTDNCGVNFPFTPLVTYDCNDVGTLQNYNISIDDINGNTATCNNQVTIVDNIPPDISCKDITLNISQQNGTVSIAPEDLESISATDNCGIDNKSVNQNTFNCTNIGPNTVVLSVTDVNGNTSTCSSIVSIICPTLPIELESFTATIIERNILLQWTTLSEINNDFFTLEHSRDGIQFEIMGHVDGKGNSTSEQQYTFIHKRPLSGPHYYRLRQTDFDGTSTWISIEYLDFIPFDDPQLLVYPNPVTDRLNYQLAGMDKRDLRVRVFNVLSEEIWEGEFNGSLQIEHLEPGVYWLSIGGAGRSWYASFVKR